MRNNHRNHSLLTIALLTLSLCGCTAAESSGTASELETTTTAIEHTTQPDTTAAETAAPTTEPPTMQAEETEAVTQASETAEESVETDVASTLTEAELRTLFAENLYCVQEVFMSNHLAYAAEAMGDSTYHAVTDSRFPNYEAFAAYVGSVYCAAETERLLHHYPYENTAIYTEVDGVFCIDTNYANAKAYFVNWTDAVFQLDAVSAERCEFQVTGLLEEPGDVPTQAAYTAAGAAVFENGSWRLEQLVY